MNESNVILGMYDHWDMRRVCEEVIPQVTDMSWLKPGDSVFAKIACNSGNDHPAVTSPRAVEALVEFLRDRGAGTIYVGDQAGVEHCRLTKKGRRGSTYALMHKNGLLDAIKRARARPCLFDEHGWDDGYFQSTLNFPNNWNGRLWMAKIINEVDHIVYLTRLGAHLLAGFTCGIKNAVGFWRDDAREFLHQQGSAFFEMIAESNHAQELREKFRFCLTLGESALVNWGPDFGEVYEFDGAAAIASQSLVDHDRLAFALLPWLDKQSKSVFDVSPYPHLSNGLNRLVVKWHWGKEALEDYTNLSSVPSNVISRLARLQGRRLEKIAIQKQGSAFPEGLISHLGKYGGGIFEI